MYSTPGAVRNAAALDRLQPDAVPGGKGLLMDAMVTASNGVPISHELLFASLFHPGRGIVVPCDPSGRVDLNSLSERLKNAYLGARALVGREYAFPTVQTRH